MLPKYSGYWAGGRTVRLGAGAGAYGDRFRFSTRFPTRWLRIPRTKLGGKGSLEVPCMFDAIPPMVFGPESLHRSFILRKH